MIERKGRQELAIDGYRVAFDRPVVAFIELHDRIIVLLDPDAYATDDPLLERNVVAVSRQGEFIWRIQKSVGGYEDDDAKTPSFYGALYRSDDGVGIKVHESGGFEHDLDPRNGHLSNKVFTK